MRLPTITGIMARRLLLNWRIDPAVAQRLLPAGLRPKLVRGHAIAGLCIVRLEQMRPIGLPAWTGFASENVATRMAVEWDTPRGPRQSVLIFRRDTGSLVNHLVGARLFPGIHHRAEFAITEKPSQIHARMASRDHSQSFDVALHDAPAIMPGSLFTDLAEVERFFRGGESGYSPTHDPARWDGVALKLERWNLVPMQVEHVRSSFFHDPAKFPAGSIELDSAYILCAIPHTWHALPPEQFGPLPTIENAQSRLAA